MPRLQVDTHIHHSACMHQKHLLRFIKSKLRKEPDEVVIFRDGKYLTLKEVRRALAHACVCVCACVRVCVCVCMCARACENASVRTCAHMCHLQRRKVPHAQGGALRPCAFVCVCACVPECHPVYVCARICVCAWDQRMCVPLYRPRLTKVLTCSWCC